MLNKIHAKAIVSLFIIILLGLTGCNSDNTIEKEDASDSITVPEPIKEETVKDGDVINVWYTGKLQSGEVFDTNVKAVADENDIKRQEFQTLQFTAGAGMMIDGFDKAVIGMKVGEKKIISLLPEDAYGEPDPKLVANMSREKFDKSFGPDTSDLQEGDAIMYQSDNGKYGSATIAKKGKDIVELDLNHHLAGKTLIFDIELVSIG